MIETNILSELGQNCTEMALGQIQCKLENAKYSKELWQEIRMVQKNILEKYTTDSIKTQLNIESTRKVYKACGKDPSRYRPSAESLYRRIVKGNDLYQINTLVDLINFLSLKSGYSIGGFDADCIEGNLFAGVGTKDESYEGIGRGALNIEGLPVLRDSKGGIGTPTSDEVRTAIRLETTHFFMNINAYSGKEDVLKFMEIAKEYLRKYLNARDIEAQVIVYI